MLFSAVAVDDLHPASPLGSLPSYKGECYAHSFVSRCCEVDDGTIGRIALCSDQTFQNAFLMPGFAIKLVKNIKKKLTTCGPLVLDIDYRHHYHASGIKGSYNLTVTLPDHSAIEIATMPTTKNENRQDAAAFVESVHDAIELDDNVVVLSDAKFAFINDLYTCEWRLCTFHVKKNLVLRN